VPEKSRRPNLASQCLGLALRELPARWHTEHGYRPLIINCQASSVIIGRLSFHNKGFKEIGRA